MTRPRKTRALGLAALGGVLALLALASFFLARQSPEAGAPMMGTQPLPVNGDPALVTTYEQGKALFVDKGCAGCHSHAAVGNREGVGPDLTNLGDPSAELPSDETYLRSWLRAPRAMRPNTIMPDLDLSDENIDGLLAFLLSGPPEQPSPSSTR